MLPFEASNICATTYQTVHKYFRLDLGADTGGGALQLQLYGGVWPQDWKIDPSAD